MAVVWRSHGTLPLLFCRPFHWKPRRRPAFALLYSIRYTDCYQNKGSPVPGPLNLLFHFSKISLRTQTLNFLKKIDPMFHDPWSFIKKDFPSLIIYSLTLKGLSSSSGMLWSPYWARSFSPLLSNLAAASSTLVNQEQKRSADGWKLCNDAIPEFKSLPLEETPELRLSYLGNTEENPI